MGVFGNIFERKLCDICGKECNIFGGTKLKDGRLCKECVNKLSPRLENLKHLTVDDIRDHLAYREENEEKVKNFNVTHVIGGKGAKLYLDMEKKELIISSDTNWRNLNPDILNFSQIVGNDVDIKENRTELKTKDENGKEVSFDPKQYKYSYNFYIYLDVNTPWFNSIPIKVNGYTVEGFDSFDYDTCYLQTQEMCEILDLLKDDQLDVVDEAIEYYKELENSPRKKYNKTYYANSKRYSRSSDYYEKKDPRKNHYKF